MWSVFYGDILAALDTDNSSKLAYLIIDASVSFVPYQRVAFIRLSETINILITV